MSRLVLGRMDNCQQRRSEHHLVQTLYTGSDNDMSRRYKDPSLARHIKNCRIVRKRFETLVHISGIIGFHTFASFHSFASSCKDDCDGQHHRGRKVMQGRECKWVIFQTEDAIFLPTSTDYVVDSDNIFIVAIAVVILHTHLCISCRCMLNKTKDELNSVWFIFYTAKKNFAGLFVKGNSKTTTRRNRFETVPTLYRNTSYKQMS